MSNSDKIWDALKRIEEGIDNINNDADWLAFLAFQSRFYRYSFGNTMLIYLQNPEASYVKGYRAWNKLGRYVRKGETGIAILAPCIRKVTDFKEPEDKAVYNDAEGEKEEKHIISGFRITHVFDLSQTDGDDSQLPVLVKGLTGNGMKEKELYELLKAHISKRLPFEEVEGTAAKGSYSIETGVISVRADLDYVQKIKTALHEYSHYVDFTLNPSKEISRNKRELVAESSAYITALRLGIDTSSYSVSYLRTWLKDREELKEIGSTVQTVAETIINELAESITGSAFSHLQEDEE